MMHDCDLPVRADSWTKQEIEILIELKHQKQSWKCISRMIPGRSQYACQARYYDHRPTSRQDDNARIRIARSWHPERADLTGRLLGDPPPGRSALDRRSESQPPRPRITLARSVSL